MFPCIYRVLFISKLSKDPGKESAFGNMTRILNVNPYLRLNASSEYLNRYT